MKKSVKKRLLRREWFGGILVDLPECHMQFLNKSEYRQFKNKAFESSDRSFQYIDATSWGYALREDSLSTPGTAYFDLTLRCTHQCRHCYANTEMNSEIKEMAFSEIEYLVREFSQLGVYYVRLTGGEPTLRKDFFDILEVIAEEGMKTSINTHGCYHKTILYHILDMGIQDIRVSLDGTEQVNDMIRGKGNFKQVLNTLHEIADYNQTAESLTDPTINCVLMKSNQHCIDAIIQTGTELGFKVSFGLLRPAGRADRSQMLSPFEVAEAARKVDQHRRALGLSKKHIRINFDIFCDENQDDSFRPFPFDNSKCPIGTMGLGISVNGRIMPCNYMASMNNGKWWGESLLNADLLDLWHHSKLLNKSRKVKRHSCSACDFYMTKCNGGCPATAYVDSGDLDGNDPYCVKDVNINKV